jgi:hypothetical protein
MVSMGRDFAFNIAVIFCVPTAMKIMAMSRVVHKDEKNVIDVLKSRELAEKAD